MASKNAFASNARGSHEVDEENAGNTSRTRSASSGAFADGFEEPKPKASFDEPGLLEAALQSCQGRKRLERAAGLSVLFLGLLGTAGYSAWRQHNLRTTDLASREAFEAFVRDFDKAYESDVERQMRFAIFRTNCAKIEEVNRKNLPYRLGINQFADMTPQEFQAAFLGPSSTSVPAASKLWDGLPHLGTDAAVDTSAGNAMAPLGNATSSDDSIDWVALGAVTTPKNQAQCGACWAFSSTGALEGAWKVASGELVTLSEQQLVDCSKLNMGCRGGVMDPAFEYLSDKKTCTEESYTYEGKSSTCRESSCVPGVPVGAIKGYRDVAIDDEAALRAALRKQPVSAAIEADQTAFQFYSGGVLVKGDCGSQLGHGVLLVGYGSEEGTPYWKVKNSWGDKWGEGGFIRIERGLGGDGKCGINKMASYPVVEKPENYKGPSTAPAEKSVVV